MNQFLKDFGEMKGDEPQEEAQAEPTTEPIESMEATAEEEAPQPEARVEETVQEEPGPEVYVVQSGDSLSAIAQRVYGDASAYMRIFEANSDKIKDPNLIHPGQELVIPR